MITGNNIPGKPILHVTWSLLSVIAEDAGEVASASGQ